MTRHDDSRLSLDLGDRRVQVLLDGHHSVLGPGERAAVTARMVG